MSKCGYIKRDGKACKMPAGFRTPHEGSVRCLHHEFPNENAIHHESLRLSGGSCKCKSRYEKYALQELDSDRRVAEYKYEPYGIPYQHNGEEYPYIPDVLVEYSYGKKTLIEVKTIGAMRDANQMETNYAKFEAADLFARDKGIKFKIWVYIDGTKDVWSFGKFCGNRARVLSQRR